MGVMGTRELRGFGLQPAGSYYAARYVDPETVPGVRSAFADSAVNWELPSYYQWPSLPSGLDPRAAWSWQAEWAPAWSGGSELFGMGGGAADLPWGKILLGAAAAYVLLPKGAPTPRLANPGGGKVTKALKRGLKGLVGRKRRRRRAR